LRGRHKETASGLYKVSAVTLGLPTTDGPSVLKAVAIQLNTAFEKWQDNGTYGFRRIKQATSVDHYKGVITGKTRELDEAFQQYTVSRSI
jgi:hypothetical protein